MIDCQIFIKGLFTESWGILHIIINCIVLRTQENPRRGFSWTFPALKKQKDFALCGVRQEALPLDTVSF